MKKGVLIGSGVVVLLSTVFFIFIMMNKTETKENMATINSASGMDIMGLID